MTRSHTTYQSECKNTGKILKPFHEPDVAVGGTSAQGWGEQWQTLRDMAEENVKEMAISVTFREGACLNFKMMYFVKP